LAQAAMAAYEKLDQTSDASARDPEAGKDDDEYYDPELEENGGPYKRKLCIGQVTFRFPVKDPLMYVALAYGIIPWGFSLYLLVWYLTTYRFMALYGLTVMLAASLTNELVLKPLLKQPRPANTGNRYKTKSGKPSKRIKPGMPSGHTCTSTAATLWMVLEIAFQGDAEDAVKMQWLIFALICLVPTPWARWYNEDHTAAQCAAGVAEGALFALGGFYIRAVYYPHQSAPWNTHARVDHPTLERPFHMIFDPLVNNTAAIFT